MDNNKIVFELSSKDTLLSALEQRPSERKMGGPKRHQDDSIKMYVGNRPMAFNLKQFIKLTGKQIPAKMDLFQSYNIYILSHSLGIMKEGGWKKVEQVGYKMEFEKGTKAIVLNLLPQAKFIKKTGLNLTVAASLGLNGSIGMPEKVSNFLATTEIIGLDGKLEASTDSGLVGNFSFNTYSSDIQAIGKNSNYSEWQFNRTDMPLHGKDIEMYQVLLVNRFVDELRFKCRAYASISSYLGFNTIRRETGWMDMSCNL